MVEFSLEISWVARPRLFTSSMFRSDSVVEPASAVVSATMSFWTTLIFFDRADTEAGQDGDGEEIDGRDDPVDGEGVDHHEDHADQGSEGQCRPRWR